MYLCRNSIQKGFVTSIVKFDLLGYNNENACKKYGISLLEEGDDETTRQSQHELTMARCPPVEEFSDHVLPERKYFDLFYIASNLTSHSTTLFIRRNKKGKLAKQEANIKNLPMKPITADIHIRKWRFLPSDSQQKHIITTFKREKSYQEFENEITNSVNEDVRMPSSLARLDETNLKELLEAGGVSKTSFDKWLADDSVIAFSKVKMMKSSKYTEKNLHMSAYVTRCEILCLK